VVGVVGVVVRSAEVAAPDGRVRVPIALAAHRFRAGEAAEEFHVVEKEKSLVPVGVAAVHRGGEVGAFGYPDFVAFRAFPDGPLDILKSGSPGIACVGIAASGFHIPDGGRNV